METGLNDGKTKTDAPDLSEAQDLTAGLIERLACPAGKLQTFCVTPKRPACV
ncbi:MAG: hypothetical protein ABIR56_13140 [Polaromonas sp.]